MYLTRRVASFLKVVRCEEGGSENLSRSALFSERAISSLEKSFSEQQRQQV